MSRLPKDAEARLDALAGALREGELSSDEQAELQTLLRTHPDARVYFAEHMQLAALLKTQFATEMNSAETPPAPRKGAFRRFWPWASIGVAAALALVVLWLSFPKTSKPEMPDDRAVAVLTESADAVWAEGFSGKSGASLPPGALKLETGAARIRFGGGADVIIEGPTTLELVSRGKCRLQQGRLRAFVSSQARGFMVETANAVVTDQGTEFGVETGSTGVSEVHVFTGAVEVEEKKDTKAKQHLNGGMALAIAADGKVRAMAADPRKFLGAEDLRTRSAKARGDRFAAWQKQSQTLRADPRLVAYYPFTEHPSQLASTTGEQTHGTIIGCRWVEGRWPGKRALNFKEPADRVQLSIRDPLTSLTMAAWVSIDAFDETYSSLFMSNNWYVRGQLHWQIKPSGRLELAVWIRDKVNPNSLSSGAIAPDRLGQWVHVAVVYDRENKRVTHFVDGQPYGTSDLPETVTLRIGAATLGSWRNYNSGSTGNFTREFRGRMDELAIWNTVLSAQEIQALYEAGKP